MNNISLILNIEGYPFITRFKTSYIRFLKCAPIYNIEGYPFITRFKTTTLVATIVESLEY